MRRAYMKSAGLFGRRSCSGDGLAGARQYERAIPVIARQHSMLKPGRAYFAGRGYPEWVLISRICRMWRCACDEIMSNH